MFDISADWPKNAVPANISYLHYRKLEFVDPLPFPRINRKI